MRQRIFQRTVKASALSLQHIFTSFDVTHTYIFNAALYPTHTHTSEAPHTDHSAGEHTSPYTQVYINKMQTQAQRAT